MAKAKKTTGAGGKKSRRLPDVWKHARGAAGQGAAAVLISDCHFSHEKPRGRAGSQEDWYVTMRNHIEEVLQRASELGVCLIIAGDVFHTWDQPVELVNSVASWFNAYSEVTVLMVPGQHDLPYHLMQEIKRSAVHNLQLALNGCGGRTVDTWCEILHSDRPYQLTYNDGEFSDGFEWYVVGAGWGEKWDFSEHGTETNRNSGGQTLLCAHQYVHACGNHGHPGTKVGDAGDIHWPTLEKPLRGYAAALFGDNHDPFDTRIAYDDYDLTVYNHGCLIRRTIKERAYRPEYGILRLNGEITRHPLACSDDDKWHDGEDEYEVPVMKLSVDVPGVVQMVDAVKALQADESVDIVSAVNRLLGDSRLSKEARREILELLPNK